MKGESVMMASRWIRLAAALLLSVTALNLTAAALFAETDTDAILSASTDLAPVTDTEPTFTFSEGSSTATDGDSASTDTDTPTDSDLSQSGTDSETTTPTYPEYSGGFYTDNVYVAQRLDVLFAEFPVGSYFSYTGKACTCHNRCSYYGGCDCISIYYDPEKNGEPVYLYSCQCMGFAHMVFYKIFGFMDSVYYPENASKYYSLGSLSSSKMTAKNVKKLMTNAKTGANIRIDGKHSVILLSQDENGLYVYQGNWVSPCMVNIKYWTWEEFASRYKKYGIEYVYMPVNYPKSEGEYVPPAPPTTDTPDSPESDPVLGTYRVTPSVGLRLRSGPGQDYKQLDLIPVDTVLEVTAIENGWGKVVYEGQTGWMSLSYAVLVQAKDPSTDTSAPSTDGSGGTSGDGETSDTDTPTDTDTPPNDVTPADLQVILPAGRETVYVGGKADLSGMTVTLVNSDQSTRTLTPEEYTVTVTASAAGTGDLTVTYGTLSTQIPLTVLSVGDVNADGAVSALDAMLLLFHLKGEETLPPLRLEGADVDESGAVDENDVTYLLKDLTDGISLKKEATP